MSQFLDINGKPKPTVIRATTNLDGKRALIHTNPKCGWFELLFSYPSKYKWTVYIRIKLHDRDDIDPECFKISMRSHLNNLKLTHDGYLVTKIRWMLVPIKEHCNVFYFYFYELGVPFTGQFDIDFLFEPHFC